MLIPTFYGIEDFLPLTNIADILEVEEKCFEDELYQAARLLFTSISNWQRPLFLSGRIKPLRKVLRRSGIHKAYISAKCCLFSRVWKYVRAACIEKVKFTS